MDGTKAVVAIAFAVASAVFLLYVTYQVASPAPEPASQSSGF
jgi:hypothetical protein